ncbi:ATP-binding protein [Candidatus Saccharibacteria bacterium]|nr:ATP-binding protein [Candidatus Saccharibacteria bacterium]
MYEVFLTKKCIAATSWHQFFLKLAHTLRLLETAELILRFDGAALSIYLCTKRSLPMRFAGVDAFVMRPVGSGEFAPAHAYPSAQVYFLGKNETLLSIIEKYEARNAAITEIHLVLKKHPSGYRIKSYAVTKDAIMVKLSRVTIAALDFDLRGKFLLKDPPKYLNMTKTLSLATNKSAGTIAKLHTYPYLDGEHYLSLLSYDFGKHTAVFGASGMGKTKFLASTIATIAATHGDKYHFLVIDPHDALRAEIGGLPNVKTYDYLIKSTGISLFMSDEQDTVSSVDMTLSLIKSLLGSAWNSRLERLARACLYLLTEKRELSFESFRRVLTDTTYKNASVAEVGEYLPESLQEFFMQDYNELKTGYYDITFARLLAFIDEMQLTPAFYRNHATRLFHELTENKVTLISLSQTKLGEKPVKVLAGLLMNQLFMLGMERRLLYNTILVVDEVAVVENPVLVRFLSEARKYGISCILAGQYYAQISPALRTAIFANVANYLCFRLSYDDAEHLAKYLNLDIMSSTSPATEADKLKLLTTLPAREMLLRVEHSGVPLPAVMGSTLDFAGTPDALHSFTPSVKRAPASVPTALNIKSQSTPVKSSIFDLMREQSTSRRKVNQ